MHCSRWTLAKIKFFLSIKKKIQKLKDSNPGGWDHKREPYLCAMAPPSQLFVLLSSRDHGRNEQFFCPNFNFVFLLNLFHLFNLFVSSSIFPNYYLLITGPLSIIVLIMHPSHLRSLLFEIHHQSNQTHLTK